MKRSLAIALAMLALTAGFLAPAAQAAQDFNVGDRVEFDVYCSGDWWPGVVMQESDDAYLVRGDSRGPGIVNGEYTIPKTGRYVDCIRPSTKPLPPDQVPDTRQPTGILTCPITTGLNNKKFSKTLVRNLIRCLYESKDGLENDSRVDITGYQAGQRRYWGPYDLGNGNAKTIVYPIKITATQLWWTDDYVTEQRWIKVFNCFYSTFKEWECGLAERTQEWPSITRPRG